MNLVLVVMGQCNVFLKMESVTIKPMINPHRFYIPNHLYR